MTLPLISIIIPAYNSANTIVETLESIKVQTFTDYEVIVVDDCSTDDTVKVVESLLGVQGFSGHPVDAVLSESSSVSTPPATQQLNNSTTGDWRLFRQTKNDGPAVARNRGIAEANGKWIAFVDADDIWLPNKLELQLCFAAQHPEVALWCGETIGFDDGDTLPNSQVAELLGRHNASLSRDNSTTQQLNNLTTHSNFSTTTTLRPITLEELAVHNPISTSTVMVCREALIEVGRFDPQFQGPEDYDLWLRVVARYPATKIGANISLYRQRVGSLSMDDRKFLPQVLRVLNKAYGRSGVLAGYGVSRRIAEANQYRSASWMAFQRGARVVALKYLAHACLLYPLVGGRSQILLWWRYLMGRRDFS